MILTKRSKKIISLVIIVSTIILSSLLTFSLSVFIMQVFLALLTLPIIMKKDYKWAKLYALIFVVSIIFVFLVYIANNLYYGSPYYIGGSDDINFENEGKVIVNSGMINPVRILESELIGRWHNATFFSLYISFLIRFSDLFGGYSTFLPRIMNVYYLIWSCFIFQYLFKKYANFNEQKIYISIAIFALTPNIQYINSHVFRDIFNLLQLLSIIFLFDRLMVNKQYLKKLLIIGIMAFLIFITYYTRENSLVFACAICILILEEKLGLKNRYIIMLIIPMIMMSNFVEVIELRQFIEFYTMYVLNLTGDGLSSYVFREPLLPFGIILRALYAFITPFPNFLGLFKEPSKGFFDAILLIVYFGVLIQILAIPFILKRLSRFDWLSLSFLVCFVAIIATTFTFRHVLFYYPFLVAVGVDGYITSSKRFRQLALFCSGFMGFFLAITYVLLKFFS